MRRSSLQAQAVPQSLSALAARSFWDQMSLEMSVEELGSGLKELNEGGTGRHSKLLFLKLVKQQLGARRQRWAVISGKAQKEG